MDQNKWDRRWLGLARHYAGWSNDPSTQVGCVIARGKDQLSQGYNGFPTGIADTDERLADRDTKLALTIHAEQNSLLRIGARRAKGASLYVWPFPPCHACAAAIVQAGIKRVVIPLEIEPELMERWRESLAISRALFAECQISLIGIPETPLAAPQRPVQPFRPARSTNAHV